MRVLLFANTEWYLFNFRRSLAMALRESGHEVLLVSPPGPYGERLAALGFNWRAAPMQRLSLNPWRELQLLIWLWRLVRQERVDLVHGFTIKCAVYGSLAARLAGNRARVGAVAGMGYVFISNGLKARLLRPIVRLLLRPALGGQCARLILQNADDASLFQQAGLVAPSRLRLIAGSGVDCQRFSPNKEATDSDFGRSDAFTVLLPARMLWDKGVAELAEASRLLRAQGRLVSVWLAGLPDPGNPAMVPEERLRAWEEEGLLRWLGHVEEMPALYRAVDLVVLPSYREGLPKGLIEAAACGLPLVTTDVPGCRAVVTHEVDGLLVPARDGGGLATAIARLMDDAPLRARLGAAARAKALAQFDERIVIEKTLAVYQELLPAPARNTRAGPLS